MHLASQRSCRVALLRSQAPAPLKLEKSSCRCAYVRVRVYFLSLAFHLSPRSAVTFCAPVKFSSTDVSIANELALIIIRVEVDL